MLTAMLAVKNILGAHYDLWQSNVDQEYQEEIRSEEEREQFALLASTQPRVAVRWTTGRGDTARLGTDPKVIRREVYSAIRKA